MEILPSGESLFSSLPEVMLEGAVPMPLPIMPSDPQRIPRNSILTKNGKIITQQSKEELDKTLIEQEEKINALLENLKRIDEEGRLLESGVGVEELTHSHAKWAIDQAQQVQSGIEVIEKLSALIGLGAREQDRISGSEAFLEAAQGFELSEKFLDSLDSGLNGLAVIYESRMINHAEKVLKQVKLNYKGKTLPKEILEWEIYIKTKKQALDKKYLKFCLKGVKRTSANIIEVLSKTAQFADRTHVLKLAGAVTNILGLILGGYSHVWLLKSDQLLEEWVKNYKLSLEQTRLKDAEFPGANPRSDYSHFEEKIMKDIKDGKDVETGIVNLKFLFPKLIPKNLKGQDELHKFLIKNPEIRRQIVLSFMKKVMPQQAFLAEAFLKQSVKPLLENRKRIKEEKIDSLKPNFEELEPKIKEICRLDFRRKVSQLLFDCTSVIEAEKKNKLQKKEVSNFLTVFKKELKELGIKLPKELKKLKDIHLYLTFIHLGTDKENFGALESLIKECHISIKIKDPNKIERQTKLIHKKLEQLNIRVPLSKEPNEFKKIAKFLIKLNALAEQKGIKNAEYHFNKWFQEKAGTGDPSKTREEVLLGMYVDRQEVINQTTKPVLQNMVSLSHKLQRKFLKSALFQSKITLTLLTLMSATLLILGSIAAAGIPFAAAGLIIFIVSITASAGGFFTYGVGSYMGSKYRPSVYTFESYFEEIRLVFDNLMLTIHHYSAQRKQQRIMKLSMLINNYFSQGEDKKILERKLKKLQEEHAKKEATVMQWQEACEKLETRLRQKAWQDFVRFAHLKQVDNHEKAFDTLNALQKALEECDLRLIDDDLQSFLSKQMGIDIQSLQRSIDKDPEGIKKAIQRFFALDEHSLPKFISKQLLREEAGLLT